MALESSRFCNPLIVPREGGASRNIPGHVDFEARRKRTKANRRFIIDTTKPLAYQTAPKHLLNADDFFQQDQSEDGARKIIPPRPPGISRSDFVKSLYPNYKGIGRERKTRDWRDFGLDRTNFSIAPIAEDDEEETEGEQEGTVEPVANTDIAEEQVSEADACIDSVIAVYGSDDQQHTPGPQALPGSIAEDRLEQTSQRLGATEKDGVSRTRQSLANTGGGFLPRDPRIGAGDELKSAKVPEVVANKVLNPETGRSSCMRPGQPHGPSEQATVADDEDEHTPGLRTATSSQAAGSSGEEVRHAFSQGQAARRVDFNYSGGSKNAAYEGYAEIGDEHAIFEGTSQGALSAGVDSGIDMLPEVPEVEAMSPSQGPEEGGKLRAAAGTPMNDASQLGLASACKSSTKPQPAPLAQRTVLDTAKKPAGVTVAEGSPDQGIAAEPIGSAQHPGEQVSSSKKGVPKSLQRRRRGEPGDSHVSLNEGAGAENPSVSKRQRAQPMEQISQDAPPSNAHADQVNGKMSVRKRRQPKGSAAQLSIRCGRLEGPTNATGESMSAQLENIAELRHDFQPDPLGGSSASNTAAEAPNVPVTHSPEDKRPVNDISKRGRKRTHTGRNSLGGYGTVIENGCRRSTRVRSRPLQHWRNERFIYARVHHSLPSITYVQLTDELPRWPNINFTDERNCRVELVRFDKESFPF